MKKYFPVMAALLVSSVAVAGTKPPSGASPAQAAPESMQQTRRMSARSQMAKCQRKAKDLKGAAKEQAVQACMRGH